ncbi:hypothetical protein [Luteipulveratus mongoliensis]|uniref:RHIM domain-containing protein n=1 Tax=Luteipulveratus mongoliensis TaxID=571913 RepID=A0A0K1JH51_9MICO|nr:hypothetical protein [Luteipulveratus mongoliensis]AKU16039.1 hypothetical protein VV02_09515 [Luteipulveratus mongoliensis]
MDPLTLGVITAAVVAKMAEKSLDRAAESAVDGAAGLGGKIVHWLRQKLSSSKELDLVAEAPDSPSAIARLADIIDAEIVDQDSMAELHELIGRVEKEAPQTYQSAIGNHIVQATNSTVNVNWDREQNNS